jgi:hypothetical protein
MKSLLAAAGMATLNGFFNLTISYQGTGGELLATTGSVDQTLNYVFAVQPSVEARGEGKIFCYWNVAGDTDTMLSLWNYTGQEEDFILTFYHRAGKYAVPVHLVAKTSTMISVASLIKNGVPDAAGNVIPPDITEGSAKLVGVKGDLQHIYLATSIATFNTRTATYGEQCWSCNGMAQFIVGGNQVFGVNQTSQLQAIMYMSGGGQNNVTTQSNWSSGNASIATVGTQTGLAAGVAVGATGVFADYPDLVETGNYYCQGIPGMPTSCPYEEPSASEPVAVTPTLTVHGNQYGSIFVGTDSGLTVANTFGTDVNPTGGTLTVTSSDSNDTFAYGTLGGTPSVVVTTTDQSAAAQDRRLTFKYTVSGQSATQTLQVTARQFAYATNPPLSNNVCSLGYGYRYDITYTPYTHPDKSAVQPGIGLNGTVVSETFNPSTISCGGVTGSGALDDNSEFTDQIAYCSTAPLTACSSTNTQTLSVAGYSVRTNSLTIANTGLTYTSQGPTQ